MFAGLGLKPEDEVIVFEGKVAGDSAQGTLRLGTETFPLVLRRGYRALNYRFEHVTFRNGDVTLAGSLLLPEGKGPFPVVAFTHGSGGRTRDAHRYEAEALAGRGIAALIYDKRGTGGSTGASWEWASFAELADDAEAAVRYVRGRPEFTGRRIGLFGLSQGAWLIEMVAARCPDVGFLIVVSGGGVPTWQQELFYRANNMRADGFPEADVTEAVQFMRKRFEVARTGVGWSSIEAAAREFERSGKKWYPSHAGGMTTMTSARLWWLLVFSHDPAPFLRKIKSPLFGLFAGDDRVMPTADSVKAIERALSEAANREFTLKVIDDAYHSMGLPQRLNARPLRRVVSDDYMHALLDWTAGQARGHEPEH
jgi:pimeloyl-ACP methyl ester carboxylesterase